jgi:translation initiation factor 2D
MSNCFKGEFKITTQSLLGKADVKKLRASLLAEFPTLSKKELSSVLSDKKDIALLKCSNGTALYVPADSPPTFFDDGFGGVYPTLFTLWRLPSMMPELVTHGPVSKFLLPKERSAGADMMLPGVIVPDGGLGAFEVGQKRLIRVDGNAMPFGVGRMLVSSKDAAAGGMKGKAMAVLHVYRDSLWAYGGRKVPNDGFQADVVVAAEGAAAPRVSATPEEEEDDDDEAEEEEGQEEEEQQEE